MECIDYESITRDVNVFGHKGKLILSYDEDETLRNIELFVSRKGSVIYGMFQMTCKILSASLRRKVSYKYLINKLEETYHFEPAGFNIDFQKDMPSPAHYLAAIIKKYHKNPNGG